MERAKNVESKGQAAPVSVQEIQSEIATVTRNIEGERKKVLAEAATPGVLTSGTGFVTFFERSDAETTAVAHYSHDVDEWIVSLPPPPEAIVWKNLQQSETMKEAKELLAYALVACLYMLYLPMVIWISQIATKINMGPLQPLWGAVAPTLGLQFMVAFLPTFLILIFSLCYPLPDYTEAQQMLQNWYFIFQMVFVILVAGIGSSLRDFMVAIATEPVSSFLILGTTLPAATHFYMNFVVLQWTTHTTNLCRVVQLSKYWFLLRLYEPDQAKALSEPEDQDYYGIGSRSARFTTNLCIGIVFGTLCPWINLLVFINFAICRVVYGYLICFAETRKADLGGKFWVHQLKHIFVGNMIYCILMAGVLFGRSDSKVPGIIAVASLFYVFRSYNRFNKRYAWERLTMPEVVTQRRTPKVVSGAKFTYLQPEFVDQ